MHHENDWGRHGPARNHGCRVRDYTLGGLRHISIENEILRTVICVDKGADFIELLHKPSDTETLCQSPAGLPGLHDHASTPLAEGPFRDLFPGGWYLMLPNGPEPCTHRGAAYGFHGEASFVAWHASVEEDRAERVVVSLHTRLRRTPLLVERRISLERGSGTLILDEAVTSEAGHTVELLWGHHPTFGEPLIDETTRLDLPASTVTPALQEQGLTHLPAGTISDFHRLDGFSDGWFALSNAGRGAGIAMRWDERLFPMMGVWRMIDGIDNYPWWGRRRMLAIEPACDLPSLSAVAARGTAITLSPGERRATRIETSLFAPTGRVIDVKWGGIVKFDDNIAANIHQHA